jgi:hypothetical protein
MSENIGMNTSTSPLPLAGAVPPELDEDTRAVIEKLMTGKPLNPDVYKRIRDRADRIRDEVFQKHGLLDIGVPAIRELRGGYGGDE